MKQEDQKLIAAFVQNTPMFEAVRGILLSGMIGEDFAAKNWIFAIDKNQSDSAYGKRVKITAEALRWLESGFNDLKRMGGGNPQPSKLNEAR